MKNLARHLSFANVLSALALFVALGGTAWALANNSVKSKHIVNGQVKDKDLRELYQFGNGFDEAWANILTDGESELVFFLLGGGTLEFTCASTPSLTYDNDSGFPADVWLDDAHSTVADGGSDDFNLPASGQVDLQIWTIPVSTIDLSVHFDGTDCYYAAALQENLRPGDARSSAGSKQKLRDAGSESSSQRKRR